jgi:hypothetical protein
MVIKVISYGNNLVAFSTNQFKTSGFSCGHNAGTSGDALVK